MGNIYFIMGIRIWTHTERDSGVVYIVQVIDGMRCDYLHPSTMSYMSIIESLSKHGYGSLATKILDQMNNIHSLCAGKPVY